MAATWSHVRGASSTWSPDVATVVRWILRSRRALRWCLPVRGRTTRDRPLSKAATPRWSCHGRRRGDRAAAHRGYRAPGRRRARRGWCPRVRDHAQRAGRRRVARHRVGRGPGARPGDRCRDGPLDRVGKARDRCGGDLPRHAPHRPGTGGLGRRARRPDAPRRVHPDRGAGRLASRRGRGEALPGIGGRAGVRARVPRAIPRHPARARAAA